jgi:hypothetical protein
LSAARQIPRPTVIQLLRVAPFAVIGFMVLVLVLRGCHTAAIPNLKAPKDAPAVAPITSSTINDLTKVALPPVGGTTTTAPPVQTGTARIHGSVTAPQGPAPGAIVRIERIVAGGQVTDVATDADGRWELGGIAGGRYRVRAFLPPKFAQPEAEVFFLADGDEHLLDLSMQSFEGLGTAAAIAPDPPNQNQPFTLAIRVAARSVDADGIVRLSPLVGVTVTLTNPGSAQLQGSAAQTTDAAGVATFILVCKSTSPTQLTATVRGSASEPVQTVVVDVAAGVAASTTVPPSTSSSPGATTSTTTTTTTAPPQPN